MSGKIMLWNCLKIYCPHLATLTFHDYWLCKTYWHCQENKVQKLLPGKNKPWFLECGTLTDPFYYIFLISTKKRETSCIAKLKKERRKIPLIKCKSEESFTPSWLKSIVKSIITPKQGWSQWWTLKDQFCASWVWWQVENGSEQSSWQRTSHTSAPGSWRHCRQCTSAISTCGTS